MQLFYNSILNDNTAFVTFDVEESRHIIKVLRKKEGETLHITNGKGDLFEVRLLSPDMRKCTAQIVSTQRKEPKSYGLHMAVAPTKNNDRYEWFLEKATEIGVTEITPVICERSERKTIKKERLEKVVQSAMKQSLQMYLPKINDPVSFTEYVKMKHSGQLFVAHCGEENEKIALASHIRPHTDIVLLIGPEGDFSTPEIELAYHNRFLPVSLGQNRLRTETAAIVACAIAMSVNEA